MFVIFIWTQLVFIALATAQDVFALSSPAFPEFLVLVQALFSMYLCTVMLGTSMFYGIEQSSPDQDAFVSFVLIIIICKINSRSGQINRK